jgi:hypothetical protein
MSSLVALAVSIGVLGGVATVLYLKVGLLIWAGFIAWACFFHSGGNTAGLTNTIFCNVFGAFCAWVAAIIILSFPLADTLTLPVWAGIVVGITVMLMVLGAKIAAFSTIPASVYGYAAVFAYLLQTPDAMTKEKLMSVGLANAFFLVVISLIVGALFGYASAKVAGTLTAKAPAASATAKAAA